jgi:hypothetical protein
LEEEINDFNPDSQIEHFYRAKSFSGSMGDSIYFHYNPPNCLQIYNPVDAFPPPVSKYHTQEALSLSNIERIISTPDTPATPPFHIFGEEPAPNWCYYYQKAELARQFSRWDDVALLGDQAEKLIKDLNSNNAHELIPFIEGYGISGQIDKSVKLSNLLLNLNRNIKPLVCKTWDRIGNNSDAVENYKKEIFQFYKDIDCGSD